MAVYNLVIKNKGDNKMSNDYFWIVDYVDYYDFPEICSKKFDDLVEQSHDIRSIIIKYYRKLLKRQFKTDM